LEASQTTMSYPGYKDAPSIGESTDDQGVQSYDRLNPTATSRSHKQTHVQYAQQPAYDWSQQNQTGYGNGDSQFYDTIWKLDREQPYDSSQRLQTTDNTNNSVASNGYHVTTVGQPRISTPALNSLAYASGLESTGMSNRGNQSEAAMPTSYDLNSLRQQAPERVMSPYTQTQSRSGDSYRMNRPGSAASRPSQSYQQPSYSSHNQQQASGRRLDSPLSMTNMEISSYDSPYEMRNQTQSNEAHPTRNVANSRQNQLSPYQNMLSFIDPSQIYNPYQQEYEKRKAVEEAEKNQLDVEIQEEEREQREFTAVAQAPEPGKEEPRRERVRKSEPVEKATVTQADRRRSHGSVDPTLQAAAILSSGMGSSRPPGGDDDIEMKILLDKIQKMKSKDPAKFHQLWGFLAKVSLMPKIPNIVNVK
jgi:hypothetical protein